MTSLEELQSLDGRTAVVAGGGGRVGKTACRTLAELGADIVVADVAQEPSRDIAKAVMDSYDVDASVLELDVTDDPSVEELPETVVERHGGLDVLINTVALTAESDLDGWTGAFPEQSREAFRKGLDVNLTSCFSLVKSCAPDLRRSTGGAVVNIGSIYGVVGPDQAMYEGVGLGNPAGYAASKGGLLQLTRWLATTLAPDVRVNAISPGGIEADQPSQFKERYEARTPLGRMATIDDLKGAIALLASDLGQYITGENLCVDGGWTAW